MNTTIKCKFCGREIEISEALQHKIQEEALTAEKSRHQQELAAARKLPQQQLPAAGNPLPSIVLVLMGIFILSSGFLLSSKSSLAASS